MPFFWGRAQWVQVMKAHESLQAYVCSELQSHTCALIHAQKQTHMPRYAQNCRATHVRLCTLSSRHTCLGMLRTAEPHMHAYNRSAADTHAKVCSQLQSHTCMPAYAQNHTHVHTHALNHAYKPKECTQLHTHTHTHTHTHLSGILLEFQQESFGPFYPNLNENID